MAHEKIQDIILLIHAHELHILTTFLKHGYIGKLTIAP